MQYTNCDTYCYDPCLYDFLYSTEYITFCIASYIISAIIYYKLFEKAGEAGWKGFIPILNIYILFKIGYNCGWLFLLAFVPIINVIVEIILYVKICHKFEKYGAFCVGTVFFPAIFLAILAFGSAKYQAFDNKKDEYEYYHNADYQSSEYNDEYNNDDRY